MYLAHPEGVASGCVADHVVQVGRSGLLSWLLAAVAMLQPLLCDIMELVLVYDSKSSHNCSLPVQNAGSVEQSSSATPYGQRFSFLLFFSFAVCKARLS